MRPRFWLGVAAVLAVSLPACGDSSGPGNIYQVTDPAGDQFGASANRPDVTRLTVIRDTGGLTIHVDFAGPVNSPLVGGANAVFGFVEIDADQDSLTGAGSVVDAFRPGTGSTGIGLDYVVDLFAYTADSLVTVYDSAAATTGLLKPMFSANRMTLRVPRGLLGNDDGNAHVAAILGNMAEPTDIVPDNGHLVVGTAPGAALRGPAAIRGPATTRNVRRTAVNGKWGSGQND